MAWYKNLNSTPDLLVVEEQTASLSSQGMQPVIKTHIHPATRAKEEPAAGPSAEEGGEGQGTRPQGGLGDILAVNELFLSDNQAGLCSDSTHCYRDTGSAGRGCWQLPSA